MSLKAPMATVAVAACLALAACGDDADSGAATSDDAAATEAAAAPEPADATAVAVDAARYAGLYGDAANPDDMGGTFIVLPAAPPPMADRFPDLPDGAIMIGPMWADIPNWYLLPVSPTRFEQTLAPPAQIERLVAEFELDGDGAAVAVTLSGVVEDFGRRARTGDVPDEWR